MRFQPCQIMNLRAAGILSFTKQDGCEAIFSFR
ncbi:MAG: hypothetical protein JWN73_185 [Betaproteobacteria bacterium]|nr:hypothetical protein [Betaproteobacteria bacterium]